MNQNDLFTAINDVNDKYVTEASMEFDLSRKKTWIYRLAISAAVLALAIIVIGKVNVTLSSKSLEDKVTTPLKSWEEMKLYEKYNTLDLNGIIFSATAGRCSEDIDQLIGNYMVSGVEAIQSNEKSMKETKPEKINDSKNSIVNQYTVPEQGTEQQFIQHEKAVNVYEILGVNKNFAVAVSLDDSGECYVYCNSHFSTESYEQFAQASQIEKYLVINKIYLYENQKTYVSKESIPSSFLFDNLLCDEALPLFLQEDFPSDFLYGNEIIKEQEGSVTKSFYPNPMNISKKIQDFCRDKEYGKLVADISIDYNLFEEKNISISVYSGGFVSSNIGGVGRIIYVGKERVNTFLSVLNQELSFVKEGGKK